MSFIKRLMAALGSKRKRGQHKDLPIVSNDPYLEGLIAAGKLDKAMRHASDELALFRSHFGEDHVKTTLPLIRIGELHLDLEQYDQAKAFFEKALEIRLRNLGAGHALISECYQNLGVLYNVANWQHSDAISFYSKALEMRLELYGLHHALTAQTYVSLAHTVDYKETDGLLKAIEYLTLGLEGYQEAVEVIPGVTPNAEDILRYTDTLFLWKAMAVKDIPTVQNYLIRTKERAAQGHFISNVLDQIEADMVSVDGGEFLMGGDPDDDGAYDDQFPQHWVKLSGYRISRYPVTQAQWTAIMGSNPSENGGGDNYPVDSVIWDDTQEFIRKLNKLTGRNYRLPTEAEWEFAARGGNSSKGYKYAGSNTLAEVGRNETWRTNRNPVGLKKPNELGLYDMTGNIYEWCQNYYYDYSDAHQTNPRGPENGTARVARGVMYAENDVSPIAYRFPPDPNTRYQVIGFRLAHPCDEDVDGAENPVVEKAPLNHDLVRGANNSNVHDDLNSPNLSSKEHVSGRISEILDQIASNMIPIQGGEFSMGVPPEPIAFGAFYTENSPEHLVKLDDYQISRYLVTQRQWKEVMGSNPSAHRGCDDCPVERVSWNMAQDFIMKLNQLSGRSYRLPTEAEWEYAARGGNKSKGYMYAGSNTLDEVGWYDSNGGVKTHPVGQKQPNELGLYDMSGLLGELCEDWYGAYSEAPQVNPKGPSEGSDRVCRGGGVGSDVSCRVWNRVTAYPDGGTRRQGFRLAHP